MVTLNLLPPEYRALARQRQIIALATVAGGTLALLLIALLAGRIVYAARLEKQAASLEQQLTQLQATVSQIKQVDAARADLQSKASLIQSLGQKRLLYPILFDDFLTQMPAGVWITSFQTSPHGTGLTLTLQAKANSNLMIADWISNLGNSHYFHSPQISLINYDDSGASFTLTCDYEHTAPPPG